MRINSLYLQLAEFRHSSRVELLLKSLRKYKLSFYYFYGLVTLVQVLSCINFFKPIFKEIWLYISLSWLFISIFKVIVISVSCEIFVTCLVSEILKGNYHYTRKNAQVGTRLQNKM